MSLIDHSPPPLPAAPIEHSYLFICNRVVTHVQKEKKRGQSYISNATPIQLFKDNRLLFCKGARKINFVYFARLKKKMLNQMKSRDSLNELQEIGVRSFDWLKRSWVVLDMTSNSYMFLFKDTRENILLIKLIILSSRRTYWLTCKEAQAFHIPKQRIWYEKLK